MAVTQQYVRVPHATLNDVDLAKLRATPTADKLDLDWAGPLLLQLWPDCVELEGIIRGREKVAEYDADAYSEPMSLSAAEVEIASRVLDHLVVESGLGALPASEFARRSGLSTASPDAQREYARTHFEALRAFIRGAAQRNLMIVTWSE